MHPVYLIFQQKFGVIHKVNEKNHLQASNLLPKETLCKGGNECYLDKEAHKRFKSS